MKYAVAAIVILIVALVTPNFLQARNRSAQKYTMADMRTISTALEARATDINSYRIGRPGTIRYEDLRRALEPTYVKQLPRKDGWGHPFLVVTSDQQYWVRSRGSDGQFNRIVPGAITNFDCDILYSNGTFIQYPEGVCQE